MKNINLGTNGLILGVHYAMKVIKKSGKKPLTILIINTLCLSPVDQFTGLIRAKAATECSITYLIAL